MPREPNNSRFGLGSVSMSVTAASNVGLKIAVSEKTKTLPTRSAPFSISAAGAWLF
jgi:hypothetical protein